MISTTDPYSRYSIREQDGCFFLSAPGDKVIKFTTRLECEYYIQIEMLREQVGKARYNTQSLEDRVLACAKSRYKESRLSMLKALVRSIKTRGAL